MKRIWRLIDHLLIRLISLAGVPAYGLDDYIEVDCLPEYLDPESPQRRPPRRLHFALP